MNPLTENWRKNEPKIVSYIWSFFSIYGCIINMLKPLEPTAIPN